MEYTVRHANNRAKAKKITGRVLIYLLMTALAFILVFPYFFMVLRGLMTSGQVQKFPVEIFPAPFSIEAWVQLFAENNYFSYLIQTLKIIVFNLIAIPLSASFVAYGFSKYNFKGKKLIFSIMLGTMMLPGAVVQIPLYVMFNSFHWLDTLLPLTIPNLFGGGAIYVFLIRQYMIGVPYELEEAAKIDGANPIQRYFKIMLPLCVPVLVFIMVTVFNANCSDFYGTLLYLSQEGKDTLSYAVFKDSLYTFVTPDKANLKMAAGTFMSIFPAIVFLIFQKQLIEGISTSALKG